MLSTTLTRPVLLVARVLQWASAAIVLGLASFFIHEGPKGQHLIFQEVIAAASVVFFLPAFVSPFMPNALSKFVLLIDVVFSYLWLTAFIFAAQDYSENQCYWFSPPGVSCPKKKASESFIFLAFFFTFIGMFLEVLSLWAHRQEGAAAAAPSAKDESVSAPAPLDGPSTSV